MSNNQLPAVHERIKADALKLFPVQMHSVQHGTFFDLNEYPRELYIAGATAENSRAQILVDALEALKEGAENHTIRFIDKALSKWKSGKVGGR